MKIFIIRALFISLFIFFCSELAAERKFIGGPGNGGVSPDGKWFIDVENPCLGSEPDISSYMKFEIVNLPQNNFKATMIYGRKNFTYCRAKQEKAKPDFILYVKDMWGARNSDVIWDTKSENVTVYFRCLEGVRAFRYNTKNKNFNLCKMDSKKYSKIKKDFKTLPENGGLYSVIPGSLEGNIVLRFNKSSKEYKQGTVLFSLELLNTENKKLTLDKWNNKNIFSNFMIIAKDQKTKINKYKTLKFDDRKKQTEITFEKLELSPKEKKKLQFSAFCSLPPGEYKIQIYLTQYPAIQTKWHAISVSK